MEQINNINILNLNNEVSGMLYQAITYINNQFEGECYIVLPTITNLTLVNKGNTKGLFAHLEKHDNSSVILSELAKKEIMLSEEESRSILDFTGNPGKEILVKRTLFPTTSSCSYYYYFEGESLHYIALKDAKMFETIIPAIEEKSILARQLGFSMGYTEDLFKKALDMVIKGNLVWTKKKQIKVGLLVANRLQRIEVFDHQLVGIDILKNDCTDILIGSETGEYTIIFASRESVYFPKHYKDVKLPVEIKVAIIIHFKNHGWNYSLFLEKYPKDLLGVYDVLTSFVCNNVIFKNPNIKKDRITDNTDKQAIAVKWWRDFYEVTRRGESSKG